VNDERKPSLARRQTGCVKVCGLARGHRRDAALAVLVAIMEDEAVAPRFRIAAANSVLAWTNTERVADPAVDGTGGRERPPVGIAWFDPARAMASSAKSGTKDLS